MAHTGETSTRTFAYTELFWSDYSHTVNRYLFQVEYSHGDYPSYFHDFSFSILNLQPEDAGTYHVSLFYDYYDRLLVLHTYRLFTIYLPPAPLLCERKNLTLLHNKDFNFELTCSIPDAYPVVDLHVMEPKDCIFKKHYSREGNGNVVIIIITSCGGNSTVGCVATQGHLDFMSITGFSDSCAWEVPKTYPVYQPPTPLVCEGPSSSPSASYHVVLSCSITDGYPPINLEVIKPEDCDYQKYYTDNNGTKELSVYVTSCHQNSTIGCIATQEPFESLSSSQYADRCEFNISRTDQAIVGCSFHRFDGPHQTSQHIALLFAGAFK
ncbi:hypothetical protein BSL78_27991 [Apostichopus japonicus]|uniref:Uncharacterized protein n=1 Tax=Stichopus japonicus TaxID=307972 RepID=A0A2G8JHE5_STIJA|nr:hypothetical protein BSL78_27991 [Apostichopus japonicus]